MPVIGDIVASSKLLLETQGYKFRYLDEHLLAYSALSISRRTRAISGDFLLLEVCDRGAEIFRDVYSIGVNAYMDALENPEAFLLEQFREKYSSHEDGVVQSAREILYSLDWYHAIHQYAINRAITSMIEFVYPFKGDRTHFLFQSDFL